MEINNKGQLAVVIDATSGVHRRGVQYTTFPTLLL